MLSTSIKFPIAAGNSETTTTPQYHRSEGARLRTWTRALPTKCNPWTMPQGNLSPRRYAYKRTCRRLRKGGGLFSAWNTSSDVPPRDPSAAARSFFFQRTHIVKPHPPSLPKRGVGMGVGWAYETLVTQGRPKQGQDTYSHLSGVAYSHHPIEDNAKSTWLDSKPGKKNAPRRWGTPTILSIRITRRSIVYMVRSQTHLSTGITVGQMEMVAIYPTIHPTKPLTQ